MFYTLALHVNDKQRVSEYLSSVGTLHEGKDLANGMIEVLFVAPKEFVKQADMLIDNLFGLLLIDAYSYF